MLCSTSFLAACCKALTQDTDPPSNDQGHEVFGLDYMNEVGSQVHEQFTCDVMMAGDECLRSTEGDEAGLAVTDTACQRTMRGPQWKGEACFF